MKMAEKQIAFIGIDFGTTNSSASWGTESRDNTVKVKPIPIDVQVDSTGANERRELVPSVVFFPVNDSASSAAPVVGPWAKKAIETSPMRVVRSVKLKMGTNWTVKIDGKDHTPVDVGTHILKKIHDGVKHFFQGRFNGSIDAVITVPASFNTNQRQATIDAARNAGFNVVNLDGSSKDVLIDEPRASLYDLLNMLHAGDFPLPYDFSEEKYVLVYDFGGGTLDVSLHAVKERPDNKGPPIVSDISLSRYTDLGGDVFDETIMKHAFSEYQKMYQIDLDKFSKEDLEAAKRKLLLHVENLKIRLSTAWENKGGQGVHFSDVREIVQPGFLLGMNPFQYELSLQEYKDIVKELLGEHVKFPTLETINDSNEERHILAPILDVLQKAWKRKNTIINPDIVLLAGGMNRFPIIKERVKDFFGKNPIQTLDPERSVSRGAAIYHYYLSKGFKATNITAEPVYMGIRGKSGSATKLLVAEGVPLPFKTEILSFETGGDNLSKSIPIYKDPDRKKIITNLQFTLRRPVPPGTKVSVQASVDESKIFVFKAWLKDDLSERIEAKIDLDEMASEDSIVVEAPATAPKPVKNEPISTIPKPLAPVTSSVPSPFNKSMSESEMRKGINKMLTVWKADGKYSFMGMRPADLPHLEKADRVITHLLHLFKNGLDKDRSYELKVEILNLIGTMVDSSVFKDHVNYNRSIEYIAFKMMEELKFHDQDKTKITQRHLTLVFPAILGLIARCKRVDRDARLVSILITWMDEIELRPLRAKILSTLGQLPPNNAIVTYLVGFLVKDHVESILAPAIAAIGKQCSRDASNPVFQGRYASIGPRMIQLFERWWKTKPDIAIAITKAIASMYKFNKDNPSLCVDEGTRSLMMNHISRISTDVLTIKGMTNPQDIEKLFKLRRALELLPSILSGESLDVDEDREFMDVPI